MQLDELAHDREAEAGAGAAERPSPSSPERKRPKTRSRCSTGTPGPESATVERGGAVARARARTRTVPPTGVWRMALASRFETMRLTRSTSKRARTESGTSTIELDLAIGGQRLELLRDRPHRAGEVGVDEREPRLAVVGLDLLEHVVDLLERAERGEADADELAAERRVVGLARSSCSERVMTTWSGARRSCESSPSRRSR